MTYENIVKKKYLHQKSLHQKPGGSNGRFQVSFSGRNLQQNTALVNSLTNQLQNMPAGHSDTLLQSALHPSFPKGQPRYQHLI